MKHPEKQNILAGLKTQLRLLIICSCKYAQLKCSQLSRTVQIVKLSRIRDLLCDDVKGQKGKWVQNFDKRVSDMTESVSEL